MSEDFHVPLTPSERHLRADDEALKFVLVDQSHDAINEARDLADARLDQELGEGGRFKKFVNGIWKGNIAKDYYRQKYIHQELDTMREANDVLAASPAERRIRATKATIDRFQSEYDELIHTNAGEHREVQTEDSALATGIKKIVRDFAYGELSAQSLQEERTRLLNEYRATHGAEAAGKGLVTTDNLLDIARAVVGMVEHTESLDRASKIDAIVDNMQVVTGEARNGVRTEARYNKVDKVIEKLADKKITSLITPGTLAVGVAAAGSIARLGSHSVIGAVTKTLLPGAAAAAWAGLRENRRVKDERTQHAREMATGGQFDSEHDKRRIEMEKTRYETIAALDLIGHLQTVGDEETLDNGGNDALQVALDALAAVQARVDLSDGKKLDLISYSSKTDVGEERMMLDLARREARLAVEARLTDEARQALGLSPQASVNGLITQRSLLVSRVFVEGEGGMNERDKAFAKLKAKRVTNAVAVGAVTGIVGGLVVQEAVAAIDPSRFGLIDAIRGDAALAQPDGSVHQTILAGALRGDESIVHTDASTTYESYETATNGSIELSDDHELITNEDGTIDLKDANGHVSVEGLVVDGNGTFDQASLDKLDAAGMVVEDHSFDQDVTTTTTQTVSTEQYLANHAAESTHVTRDFWYDNDTPAPNYDENELRVYRGGSDAAPGIVEGGYQYTVAGMHADGSWQGGERVDWNQAAASGNLFVAVSGTYDSQGNPFMIPIGPNGEVNIPADSPAGQFFANENNSVAFNGAYMEIVQTAGVDAEGTVHIRPLATLVGDTSVHEVNDTVTTVTTEHHAEYTITTDGYDTTQENFTEMAPITPIASRRSMEALATPETPGGVEQPSYHGGERGAAYRARVIEESSPRIQAGGEAVLKPREELDWFHDNLARRMGEEYVRDVTAFVQNNPELSRMSNETETIVTMPVGGAFESETIYSTLATFALQDKEALAKTTLLLNVNWYDTAVDDPDSLAAIQKTIAEIDRAKADFPQLSVSVMQKEYVQSDVERTGGVLGYVVNDLVNTSLLALRSRMESGAMDSTHDVLVLRSDADVRGLSRTQLRNMQRSLRENTDVDVFKGATRFGVGEQRQFPGFGIVTNFSSALQMASTQENSIHTGGANFAVRASTLAAIDGLGYASPERAVGPYEKWTGVAADDVEIGNRISAARRVGQPSNGYSGTTGDTTKTRRVKLVSGAAIDTNAQRLLPYYLEGRSFQDAWETGFSSEAGEYIGREAGARAIENAPKRENYNGSEVYSFIEKNLSTELGFSSSDAAARKTLALFFAGVSSAYTISGSIGGGKNSVRFTLTDKGREFIKNRVERESNGKFGSYGLRKMRQLYGVTNPGAKRQPASSTAPLVSASL